MRSGDYAVRMTLLISVVLTLAACTTQPMPPPAEQVSTDRLMATIAALPTQRSGNGSPEHLAGLDAARDLLVARLEALGYEPKLEEVFWKPPGWDEADGPAPAFHNIIVDIQGVERPDEVLIIGAHYDAVTRAPGADDNGTGVAAVMEIARLMADRPTKCSIRLIFFTLEEVGLVGSTQHASAYRQVVFEEVETPIGMISLDMLGFFSTEPNSQRSPIKPIEGVFEPPTTADFIAMAGVLSHRDFSQRLNAEMLVGSPDLKTAVVDFMPVPVPDLMRSDHAPFLMIGVPAVIISDTANFRSPHYHRATDTIETIDAKRFTDVVKGLVHATYMLAEPADEPSP